MQTGSKRERLRLAGLTYKPLPEGGRLIVVELEWDFTGTNQGACAMIVAAAPDERKNDRPVINCFRSVYRVARSLKYRERVSAASIPCHTRLI